jgi:phosphate transport system substrate-binding protein
MGEHYITRYTRAPMTPPEPDVRAGQGVSSKGARVIGWTLSLAGSALLVLTGALLIGYVESGPLPPYLDPNAAPPTTVRPPPKPANLLRLAGSGSNLPVTNALANAFMARRPWLRVRVNESIGSVGGVQATLDRAIDIGLISRRLKAQEREAGLVDIAYARVAVVVAANPSVPLRKITRTQLLDLYSGRATYWEDGSPVELLKREPGDSSHLAMYVAVPEFEAVDAEAWTSERGRRLLTDRAMQEALIMTPGAVGLFDQGLAVSQNLPISVLEFEGLRPNEDALRSGKYPIFKDLAFVVPSDDPDPLAAEFIAFVFSPEGQELIRQGGYIPLDPPPRSSFAHHRIEPLLSNDESMTTGEDRESPEVQP